jgi:hypothetical protein
VHPAPQPVPLSAVTLKLQCEHLCEACESNDLVALKSLLVTCSEHVATLLATCNLQGVTALYIAAKLGNFNVVTELLRSYKVHSVGIDMQMEHSKVRLLFSFLSFCLCYLFVFIQRCYLFIYLFIYLILIYFLSSPLFTCSFVGNGVARGKPARTRGHLRAVTVVWSRSDTEGPVRQMCK